MHHDQPRSAIAIVGMSGRFPGASGTDELWRLLDERRETVATAPAERAWMHELHAREPRTPGRIPTDRGGFLTGIDVFDNRFFDMSPREAARTDPQLRLLLETAHEVLEDAGIPRDRLATAPTGVFIGNISGDYWLRHVPDLDSLDIYSELGTARAAYSGKLSYAFGLDGPSLSVDSACSSSLLAVHLACQSLRAGECDAALAGGVNLILTPHMHLTFGWAGSLSPDGSCKFADASANGFVRSEAVGLVLLKPLEAALAAGDRVRAVILGDAVNNNAFTGNGLAAPSHAAQVAVVRRALRMAGVEPADVDFVEAHGTGTPLGDRVELRALGDVMAVPAARSSPCLVGSVKTNIGHTEAAAGVTGLIKAVLCMEHRRFPGNPHLLTPNPEVDWSSGRLTVPADTVDLPPRDEPLLAGVNSFGATGTNVHLVLASAPEPTASRTPKTAATAADRRPMLLPLSARSGAALSELASKYGELASGGRGEQYVREVCSTAAHSRTHWERRLAFVAGTADEMAEGLARGAQDAAAGRLPAAPEGSPKVIFVFPGQGSQWLGMGRELMDRSEAFRSTLDQCGEIIAEHTGWSLMDALRGDDVAWHQRTSLVQPALWAVSVALSDHWRSWGIRPAAVIGQSQGEIAAAYCAGALGLAEAGRLSCVRAELIEKLAPAGAMAWVGAGTREVGSLLTELDVHASVAVEESRAATVLSGSQEDIDRLARGCEERGLACRPVQVSYAAHSAQIDPVRRPLLDALDDLAPTATGIPFLSTVTAAETEGTTLDGAYWWRNLRETVRLEPAVRAAIGTGPTVFLQISPHPLLTPALDASVGEHDLVLGSLWREEPELLSLYRSLGRLYEAGADVDWTAVHGAADRSVPLPRYPWQRERHWYQAPGYRWPEIGAARQEPAHPLLSDPLDPAGEASYLLGHRVGRTAMMPGTGFVELLLHEAAPSRELTGIDFTEALPLDGDLGLRLRVVRDEAPCPGPGTLTVESRSAASRNWTRHATATATAVSCAREPTPAEDPNTVRERCTGLSGTEFYRRYSGSGNTWEGAFTGVREAWLGAAECLARVAVPPADRHRVHPVLLDACLQPVAALVAHADRAGRRGFVLAGIDRLWTGDLPESGHLWSHVRLAELDGDGLTADVTVSDEEGNIVMELTGVRSVALASAAPVGNTTTPRQENDTAPEPSADYTQWAQTVSWQPARLPGSTSRQGGGNWLLLGADGPLGRRLARSLARSGGTVTQVAEVPDSDSAVQALLLEAAEDTPLDGVIVLWTSPVAAVDAKDASPRQIQEAAVHGCAALSTLVRTLSTPAEAADGETARLYVVTRGTQDTPAGAHASAAVPWRAALWGLGLVAGRENPALRLTLVDLDPAEAVVDDSAQLARVVLADVAENRIALRGADVLAPRLAPDPAQPPGTPARELYGDGGIGSLVLRDLVREEPGTGEVEIEVSHAGLNFHDVLALTGTDRTHTGGTPKLGCECAGIVTALGDGVTGLAVGDPVLAFVHPALRSHVIAPAALVRRRPPHLTPAEAAALPAAHATAYYALVDRARLAPGERVLIHSATGGVGLAAIDVARMCGATVYATAGTPAKRRLLEQMGVENVGDSRSTRFAQEFRDPRDPDNGGVDVILNTLVGEAVEANFSLLNPFGRYIDLAVNDIADNRPLPMGVFAAGRCYLPVDFADLYERDRERLADLIHTVTDLVQRGQLTPPSPRVIPVEDAADAFSLLARAGHTGKVVLSFPTPGSPRHPAPARIRSDASYLVTGGLSGVGGLVSRWLASQGAGHLLLTGRTDESELAADDPRARLLEDLRATRTRIEYAVVDAADAEALTALLDRRGRDGIPPVAGVVHSAAALSTGPVSELTAHELRETFQAKVAGGWALHRTLADEPLEFFTLFSSVASVLGGLALGHHLGAYAAANAFTDALATYRLAQGMPTTVVNWGYWDEVGLAARLTAQEGHDVRPRGMGAIAPDDAPGLFSTYLTAPGHHVVYPPADWGRYLAGYREDARNPILTDLAVEPDTTRPGSHALRAPRRTPPLRAARPTTAPATPRTPSVPAPHRTERHATTKPAAHREAAEPPTGPQPAPTTPSAPDTAAQRDPAEVVEYMKNRLGRILGLRADQIDTSRPMNRLGLDSLMATELRAGLRKDLGIDAQVSRLMSSGSLRGIAAELAAGTPRTTA